MKMPIDPNRSFFACCSALACFFKVLCKGVAKGLLLFSWKGILMPGLSILYELDSVAFAQTNELICSLSLYIWISAEIDG